MTTALPPLAELARRLRDGTTPAAELMASACAAHDPAFNAYKTWNGASATKLAAHVDGLLDAGVDPGPLAGIPVSVKDLFGVPGLPTFAGTDAALPDTWQRPGPIVARLGAQLGLVTGKTHTVEFAFGGVGTNPHWGAPVNPWSEDAADPRAPGGSSSGAGVSLAEGSALVALGSDTAGSVRIPASVTGQVGLKLTHGRWPLDGIVPLSPSFDTPGLLCRTVEDVAFAFDALDPDYRRPSGGTAFGGLRIGVAGGLFADDVDPSIADVVERALRQLEGAHARLVPATVPASEDAMALFRRGGLAAPELAAFLEDRFPERIARLDPTVGARVGDATGVSATEYLKRRAAFDRAAEASLAVFDACDIVVSATVATTPPRLSQLGGAADYAAANMLMLRNTAVANLLGWCAITMPVGLDDAGLPVGLMLMAPPMAEDRLLAAALAAEAVLGTGPTLLGQPRLTT